ncbi:MAG: DUF2510 domain-containing protein [Actinomycetia bacterium]|nr:DUF2510 domain-containing protein [Actinomycetes bacterium]
MSSAPPGWHRQPDGRERFWDGARWTNEFRDPSSAPTESIPIDATRGMRTAPRGPAPRRYDPRQGEEQYISPGPAGRPRPPDRYADYGPLSDRPSRGGGFMRGCLVVLLVLLVIGALGVGIGWFLHNRTNGAADPGASASPTVESTVPTTAPTAAEPDPESEVEPEPDEEPEIDEEPETPEPEQTGADDRPELTLPGLPTALPTSFPTALPTLPSIPGQGEAVRAGIGEAFAIGGAEVQAGWTISEELFGFRSVTMTAVPQVENRIPLLVTVRFLSGATEIGTTMCTIPLGSVGVQADVTCVPTRSEIENADTVEVGGFG